MFLFEVTLSQDVSYVTDYWLIKDSRSTMETVPPMANINTKLVVFKRLLIIMEKKNEKEKWTCINI